MSIKAILFDLDGTLLNREQSLKLFIDNPYDRFAELHQIDKEHFKMRFMELDNYGYVWKDKVYQYILKEFSIQGLDWARLLIDYIKDFQYFCVPYPHLIKTLTTLKDKGIKFAL